METILTPIEARALACLIEKEATTPEYYPLSINSLTNACNQKSNRDPVVDFEEKDVIRAVENMRDRQLISMVTGAGSRVAKYKHSFGRRFQFNKLETAALCILMLRGPQTVGEIRGRTNRLCTFADLNEVEQTLNSLMSRGEGAYVTKLPKQPGRKESRYAHLLCGEPENIEFTEPPAQEEQDTSRLVQLEEEISDLKTQVAELKTQFDEFRSQFD